MKIAVLTRHAISNYGSILQTYATQRVLEELGNKVEIIDYIRNDEEYRNITKVLLQKSKKWNKNFITRSIYRLIQSPEYKVMGKKFEKFRMKLLNLSNRRYSSFDELKNKSIDADLFCTGSDQVWGPIGSDKFDDTYFLEFVKDKTKCFSYAGSFGKTIFDDFTIDKYKQYLSTYSSISVREKSALEIVKQMGIENVSQVLDPTLLLDKNQWEDFIKNGKTPKIKKEYILIYQLHKNSDMDKYAKELSKRMRLPLIRITPTPHNALRGGKGIILPEVEEFLAYIKNAKYFITDSFHGTAFAINFGTQFINIHPGVTATRNLSILELTGLSDRMIGDYENYSVFDKKIDFNKVHDILNVERKKSLEWLKSTINSKK